MEDALELGRQVAVHGPTEDALRAYEAVRWDGSQQWPALLVRTQSNRGSLICLSMLLCSKSTPPDVSENLSPATYYPLFLALNSSS